MRSGPIKIRWFLSNKDKSTYIIDEMGLIEKVMEKVKPDTNAEEILKYLEETKE